MMVEYFGNTITDEEIKLLRTLPAEEARALHEKIMARIKKDFPSLEDKMTLPFQEFIEQIDNVPVDIFLGNPDEALEATLEKLVNEEF